MKQVEEKRAAGATATLVQDDGEENASLVGEILGGQYEILEIIGEGGIGIVYRARQLTVGRDVAIKILKKQFAKDELASRRFENEASAISRLRHPNTLRLYDCQRTTDGDLFLVTEHLTGKPLSELLRKGGRLPLERALHVFEEVCRSLGEAHAQGIVHRDLKPANIFLDHVGSEDLVKVLDFGIAKILQGGGGLTRAGAVPGTPQYMSPEQAQAGRVDHRADIYTLGIILFQLVSGRPPFDGPSVMDILAKHITEPAPSIAEVCPGLDLPAKVEQLIFWMLEKSPDKRPQSIEEIREQLPDIVAEVKAKKSDSAPRARSMPPMTPRPSSLAVMRRWRWISLLTGSLGVILGVLVGYVVVPTSTTRPRYHGSTISVATLGLDAPRVEPSPDLPPGKATIISEPSGAEVLAADGERVGVTPLDVALLGSRKYTLRGENGQKGAVVLDPERDAGRTVRVILDRPLDKKDRPTDRKRRVVAEKKKRH